MSRAHIIDGTWRRKVPWKNGGQWRTDIFKTVLSDPQLKYCRFELNGGPTVLIAAPELRRILEGGRDHYDSAIWGPFNINPTDRTVDGHSVQMEEV
jgi:hypothetical protein